MAKIDLTQPTTVIIPVATAIERTTNWRNFVTKVSPSASARKLPKAVYISKDDIEKLSRLMHQNQDLVGVRAYFTIDIPAEEEVVNDVSFVMVPVRKVDGKAFGEDVLYKEGSGKDITDPDDSEVYDYTMPCPNACDEDSPLFGG